MGTPKKVVKGYPVAYSAERDLEVSKKSVEEVFSSHGHPVAFTVQKMTYDVTSIDQEQLSCIDEEGSEVTFNFPQTAQGEPSPYFQELLEKFQANDEAGGDAFWTVTMSFFPLATGEITYYMESWKAGAEA